MSIGSISRTVMDRRWPFGAWRATGPAGISTGDGATRDREAERRRLIASLVLLCIPAALLLLSGAIAGLPAEDGEIERGVSVAGVAVAGDGWEAALPDLKARFDAYLDEPVTIEIDGRRTRVSPRELGFTFDLDATERRARGIGRGMFFPAAAERFRAHAFGVDLDPVVTIDTDDLVSKLHGLGAGTIEAPVNAGFAIAGGKLSVQPSAPGTAIDAADAAKRLRTVVADLADEAVVAPVTPVQPEVTTAALERVRDRAAALTAQPLLVRDAGQYWQITPEALAALLTVRDGALALDTRTLEPIIASLSSSIDRPAQPARIVHNGDATFSIEPEIAARTLDVDASVAAIERSFLSGEHQIALITAAKPPRVTAQSLKPLLAEANQIAASGMKVRWPDGEQELDKAAFAGTIVPDPPAGEITFDRGALFTMLEPIAHTINRPATGYRWKGGAVVAPEDALPGRLVDINASIDRLTANALAGNPSAELVVNVQEDVSVIASQVVISDLLGSASTYYGTSSANRKTNVELGAASLDGALVPPGGRFSFNQAIGGTASLEDGYQLGFGIVSTEDGTAKTVPSVAGGICQVATTVFQSAFWAGMPISTRSWHSYWIPNYGSGPGGMRGLDATVDPDYGLDFTFENPTDAWLAIRAVTDGEWLTVEVWGVSQGWEVSADEPVISNVVKADPTWVRQQSDQIPAGQEIVVEHAEDGFTAAIHRTVRKDGQVIHEQTFTSYYVPSRNLVLVGAGAAPEPQPAPEPPAEQPSEQPAEEPAAEPTAEPTPEPIDEPAVEQSPSPDPTETPAEPPSEEAVEATPVE